MSEKESKEEAAVPEPAEGRRFIIFKPKGERNFSAHIVLPNGYKEVLETGKPTSAKATSFARGRLQRLQKEKGVPTLAEEQRAKGITPAHEKWRANAAARAAGEPEPFPIGHKGRAPGLAQLPLPTGPTPIRSNGHVQAEDSGDWRPFTRTYEQRCVQFFLRVTELMLLGAAENPTGFTAHMKAIVLETIEGARKRTYNKRAKSDDED